MNHLLWSGDGSAGSSFAGINQLHSSFACRKALGINLGRWESQGLLEPSPRGLIKDRFIRLTQAGRIIALGGRDPDLEWERPWDGRWRLIFFDLPKEERTLRKQFDRALSECRCGRLQGSVWISPEVPEGARRIFDEKGSDCSHLMMMETVSKGRTLDRKMVRSAWDFKRINDRYEMVSSILDSFPHDAGIEEILLWEQQEHEAWLAAVECDPLLPKSLHPDGYMGVKVWRRRARLLRNAGKQYQAIKAESP